MYYYSYLLLAVLVLASADDVVLYDVCDDAVFSSSDFMGLLFGIEGFTNDDFNDFGIDFCHRRGVVQLEEHDIAVSEFPEDEVRLLAMTTTDSLDVAVDLVNDDGHNFGGTQIFESRFTVPVDGSLMFNLIYASDTYPSNDFNVGDAYLSDRLTYFMTLQLADGNPVAEFSVNENMNSELFVPNYGEYAGRPMEWNGRTRMLQLGPVDLEAGQDYWMGLGLFANSGGVTGLYVQPGAFTPNYCSTVAQQCSFEFEGSEGQIPVFDLVGTQDNSPFSSVIVAKSSDLIGQINSDGAYIVTAEGEVAAKTYLDAFSDNQFKTFGSWTGSETVTEIGHETFQQDSRSSASGLCVKVEFSNWQVLNADGHVTDNVQKTDGSTDCVVFRTI